MDNEALKQVTESHETEQECCELYGEYCYPCQRDEEGPAGS